VNWRVIFSRSTTTEALNTSLRLIFAVTLVVWGFLGYRLYAASARAGFLEKAIGKNDRVAKDASDKLRAASGVADRIPRSQLEAYAPTQFASLLDTLAKQYGCKVEALRAETSERVALDNFEGGAGIEGWKVLGYEVDMTGRYAAIHSLLASLVRLPMPFEITAFDSARIGSDAGGSKLQVKFKVEVYQPGSQAASGGAQ